MQAEIELYRPQTLAEALSLLAHHAPDAKPVAGGTNLVVELRDGHHDCKPLIDLAQIRELRGIEIRDGAIQIGGGTTISELLDHPLIAKYASILRDSATLFANPLVRNRATVAGNLVDASPAADTAPPLLALGAEVQLVSQNTSRWIALEDFITGVRKTVRQPDELLLAIRWPIPSSGSAGAYTKVGLRKADAISVLSAAVMVERDPAGRCTQARIALGAVAPRPFRATEAENSLAGQPLQPDVIARVAHLAALAARPIDDIRGKADYRRRITEVTVRRLLNSIAELSK